MINMLPQKSIFMNWMQNDFFEIKILFEGEFLLITSKFFETMYSSVLEWTLIAYFQIICTILESLNLLYLCCTWEIKKASTFLSRPLSTRGGNRTHTPKNWILNPARLPVPPLEQGNYFLVFNFPRLFF